jgi:CBS-domain-containing membrane protein
MHKKPKRKKKLIHSPSRLFRISKIFYFPKMRGGHPSPPRPKLSYIFVSWIATVVAISALWAISYFSDSAMIIAPFGATCVLIFAVPDGPLSQPRNVIGGHLLATAISLIFLHLFGDQWWVITLAVATSIAAMQATKTLHPPAGADPLVVILSNATWSFIAIPVFIGSVVLIVCAVITNNLSRDRHYPKYWW